MASGMGEATERQDGTGEADAAQSSLVRRLMPVVLILSAIGAVFASGLDDYLTFSALREHREALLAFVAGQPFLAPLAFIAIYALATALSLPGGVILTIAGGFLFGTWVGGFYSIVGATLGAIAIFLIAKTALGDTLRSKAGPWMAKMEEGFKEDELSYLLILRLVPLFPFWLVNLVPAFLGMSLTNYTIGTFIGIIPGGLAYASVGAGLGAVFDQGAVPGLEILTDPKVWGPMVALTLLALVPIIYKRFAAKKAE
ncbi:MAG: TVP38/TMEM64 family protein [Alphaproteobacteria bacterium]|nr:TVP38/TMEM64 family protein [Alphaproteobacteria bacterium]